MQDINPLDYPICFAQPLRLHNISAWIEHVPFGMFLMDILHPKVLVELGTPMGVAYSAFCQAVKQLRLDTRCYVVDTWADDPHAGFDGADMLAAWRAHHGPLYGEFSRLIQSTVDQAAEYFSAGSIDLLHIDGLHTYQAVQHGFETWLPKLSKRAVVLLHDTNIRERDFVVWKFWEELQHIYPHFEFLHGHGLGVVRVGVESTPALEPLFSLTADQAKPLREFFFTLGSRLAEAAYNEHRISEKEQAVQAFTAQLAEKERVLAQLYQSKLWRLPQPLRRIAEIVRGIESRGDAKTRQGVPHLPRIDTIRQSPDGPNVSLDQFHCMIDSLEVHDGVVAIEGWAFHETWRIQQVSLIVSDPHSNMKPTIFTHKRERMDVFQQFPVEHAIHSGFGGEAELPKGKRHLSLGFKLENAIQIIVDFSTPIKTSSGRSNTTVNAMHWFRIMRELATVPRIKNVLLHFMRGDFAYLKEQLAYALRVNLQRELIKNNLELAYCAQFFHTTQNARQQKPLEQEIDIIIPVYNGMEYVVRLFDCLFKNTNTPFRVIVVDDHSPDPAVVSYLDELAQQHPNILLLRNAENKGFVGTINYATGFVRNHFVIINTDVEVPKGWLPRLMRPILHGSKVASTTPFTNAGTICSFPLPLVDNPIFGNLDVDVIDGAFQQCNTATISIELPTGVGFCMGINIEAWKHIGPFDEGRFGRGYGEENDWCMRASSAGYHNLMVPNLFVYHKHGGSFSSAEKQTLMHKNLQTVFGLHPTYQSLVEKFITADQPRPLRKFVSLLLMATASSEKPLLLIDHEIGGGANAYCKQLIKDRLQAGQMVLLLTYDMLQSSIKLQALYQNYEEMFYLALVDDLFILPEYLQIGEIFYNNLVSFAEPLEMVNAIRHLQEISGAKLTIVLHDYYPLCPSYTLLDHTGRYCDLPSIDTCKTCLPRNPYRHQHDPHDIVQWRQDWSGLLEKAAEIICFSECSARLLTRVYHLEREHITIRPHKPLVEFPRKPKIDMQAPLSIGVVGALNYPKGAQIVIDVAKIFSEHDPSVKITVIGMLNGINRLSNLTVTGQYEVSCLPDILEQYKVNVCFFPSIWPETFSYVTSELIALEMPLCAFDIGAPAERIRKYKLGHVMQKIDAETAAREIKGFYDKLAILLKN